MKNNLLTFAFGILVGITGTALYLFKNAPDLMLAEKTSKYDFPTTVEKLQESALLHGWKVVAVHDLQQSMKQFGKDVDAVKVFALCKPEHAYQVLNGSDERVVSALMPCRVAVYQKEDGKTCFSFMNASLLARAMGGTIKTVMTEAMAENREILQPLLAD